MSVFPVPFVEEGTVVVTVSGGGRLLLLLLLLAQDMAMTGVTVAGGFGWAPAIVVVVDWMVKTGVVVAKATVRPLAALAVAASPDPGATLLSIMVLGTIEVAGWTGLMLVTTAGGGGVLMLLPGLLLALHFFSWDVQLLLSAKDLPHLKQA